MVLSEAVVRQSDIESPSEQISQQMVLLSQIGGHPGPSLQIRQREREREYQQQSQQISITTEMLGLRSLFMVYVSQLLEVHYNL